MKERELGYRIVREDTPDDPFEVAQGFGATELVDLENAPEPEFGWYVHASFELPATPTLTSRHQGVLGVDVNAWTQVTIRSSR